MMKKVIDILPPRKAERPKEKQRVLPETEESEEEIIPTAGLEAKTPVFTFGKAKGISGIKALAKKISVPPLFKQGFRARRAILVFAAAVPALLFIVSFFTLGRAEIQIWPDMEKLSAEAKIVLDANKTQFNSLLNIIPAESFQEEKTISEDFSSSGQVFQEKKAEGVIKTYNNYSTSPQALLAGTRFVSSDGKLFRSLSRVTVPGAKYENGKLVPGEIDVKVAADKAGPEYNIGPSTFSIPGFAGTVKYTKFYGKSSGAMSGGSSSAASAVTEGDLRAAEETVSRKVKDEAEAALKEKIKNGSKEGYSFFENLIQTEITNNAASAKAGDAAKQFNFQAKASSFTLVFSKEHLDSIAEQLAKSKIPEGKELNRESLKITAVPDSIDQAAGKISFSLKIDFTAYAKLDLLAIKNEVSGKSRNEIQSLVSDIEGVKEARVDFWPFWVKSAPDHGEKIKINLNLD